MEGHRKIRFVLSGSGYIFAVQRFTADEMIADCFNVHLWLVCEVQIASDELPGKEGCLTLSGTDEDRYFHGVINRVTLTGRDGRFYLYQAHLVPYLWYLSLNRNFRVFQRKTVVEIADEVLKAALPHQPYHSRLIRQYSTRRYCTQYGESDWHFVSRLFEEEGICYFFQHFSDKHILTLADDKVAYGCIGGDATVKYHLDGGMSPESETISSFIYSQSTTPEAAALWNYNFKRPSLDLTVQEPAGKAPAREIFELSSNYGLPEQGKHLARVRLEEQLTLREHGEGKSNCHRLIPGFLFEVTDHTFESLDGDYLLVKVTHTGSQGHVLGEQSGMGGDATYSNEFVAIPAEVTPRPERLLAKPRAELQSAFVVGPPGEEIYPDEYGRVKVQFHWDRSGSGTENSSCWLRVNQPWSGQGWGMSALPRVGDEVLVGFVNGDPDWPVVVGSVNNAESPALYPLPAERARSGIRTRSYPEGSSDNFHELRFDDRKGQEEVYLQSERDWNILVKHDKQETVGNDGVEEIGGDKTVRAGRCIRIQAGDSIELVCGSTSIKLDSLGNLTLNGTNLDFSGSQNIRLTSSKIDLN
jgi:type VI secretion system secreted protein VgrG